MQGGNLVAAGSTVAGFDEDFALARYNRDGTLDTRFGGDGRVTTDVAGGSDHVNALATRNGKLVAAGSAAIGGSFDFALTRYNRDGTLDTRFGVSGKVSTDFTGSGDEINAVAWQANGRLVAAGTTDNNTDTDFALARYRTR